MIKLADYKGKFNIGCDEYDELDYPDGEVSREQFIQELSWRVIDADYYGVPAYIGSDKEIKKIITQIRKDNNLE